LIFSYTWKDSAGEQFARRILGFGSDIQVHATVAAEPSQYSTGGNSMPPQQFSNRPNVIRQAAAILTGFVVEFSGGNDHHLGQLNVEVTVPPGGISGPAVQVQVTCGLRDWSGN
jgi:hypothetical protein